MEKINIAVIGYGNIGKRHVEFLTRNKKYNISCICDIIEKRAIDGSKIAKCKAESDFYQVLEDPEVDVIDICTPSGLHAKMSIDSMNNNKHAISEKPMSLTIRETDDIIRTEKETGMNYFLIKQNRYNPPIQVLKEVIGNGSLGELLLISSNVFWNRRESYFKESDWRGSLEFDGGALFTQSSHFVDLILWLGGVPRRVSSIMNNISHPYIQVEDIGNVRIEFDNQCIGILNYTTSTYEANLEGSLTVLGTKGSIKIGGKYLNELTEWNVDGIEKPELPKSNPPNIYEGGYQGSMSNHHKVFENVVNVLQNNGDIHVTSYSGRLTVEVIQAAHISAYQNRPVVFPLTQEEYNFDVRTRPPFKSRIF